MRKLVVIELLSLDGVMQGPGSREEDTEGGFTQGGWAAPYFDPEAGAEAAEGMAATDAYLFGRKTYEIMAAHWQHAPSDDPFAVHLNSTKKYVASRTLKSPDWQNSSLIEGDVPAAVASLKVQDGNSIAVLGSGELVRTLIDRDLVDEYNLTLHPIMLGSGKRLFRDAEHVRRLRLADSKPTRTGCVMLTYESS